MDLITVIVPVYKTERFLNRCVRSIVCQTYQNLEILLIDDGSPDQCPELCENWAEKDSRIKVIHQTNRGISAARNIGLENASGNYILMVDSDDYLYNRMIEVMYSYLLDENADLAICDFQKGMEESFEFIYNREHWYEVITGEIALYRIYEGNDKALQYIAPWGKLYKKELFDNVKYPEGKIFEDIFVTHQLLYRCKKIVVIPQKLIYYFQSANSIMNKKFHAGKLDYLPALKQRIEFFKEHNLEKLQEIAYDEYLHALIWEYSRVNDLLHDKENKSLILSAYRLAYKKNYVSKRYPKENALFLRIFNLNPKLILIYWKIESKVKRILLRN